MRFLKGLMMIIMLIVVALFAITGVATTKGNVAPPLGQEYEKATLIESSGASVFAVIGAGFILVIVAFMIEPTLNTTRAWLKTDSISGITLYGGVAKRLFRTGLPRR